MAKINKPKDPTRPVMLIIVFAVLFVFGTLLYKALSGRNEYRAEQAEQARAWEQTHADVIPAPDASAAAALASASANPGGGSGTRTLSRALSDAASSSAPASSASSASTVLPASNPR